jgi:hypothetical protein
MRIRNIYMPKREKTYTVQKYSTQRHDLNTFHHFSNPYLKVKIMYVWKRTSLTLISPNRKIEWTRFHQLSGHAKPFHWSCAHYSRVFLVHSDGDPRNYSKECILEQKNSSMNVSFVSRLVTPITNRSKYQLFQWPIFVTSFLSHLVYLETTM